MSVREQRVEFLQAAEDVDAATFVHIMSKHFQKAEPFDVGELLVTLDRHQLEELWGNLQMKATSALLSLEVSEEEPEESIEAGGKLLEIIVAVAIETIKIDSVAVPPPLYETAVLLHGVLLSLPEDLERLRRSVGQLCEAWWTSCLDGKEDLAPQTIVHLLENSLQPKATKSDVKRVWKMHDCLADIDFTDTSSNTLRVMLQNAAISPLYLKTPEGKKLISYILVLSEGLLECIHATVKNTIHTLSRKTVDAYGEIYFKAWRNSTGHTLEKLEKACIQDFMFLAITVESKIASCNLRHILSFFHKQKKQTGVDEMLYRLYDPFMWRSLKVARDTVRAAALSVLIDAFPLQDPSARVEDTDKLREKQFDLFDKLLMDDSPNVRVIASQGVCKICNLYWEVLPPTVIKGFINKLACDLVWDGSSSDVRCAVIKGLTHLLDNHLSHPLLKGILPQLKNLLHDQSEKVRVVFVDLLLKIKGIRAIKFWHVTPVEHLLARLETDSSCVVKRIVSLLLNSYMPVDKGGEEQLSRCVSLIQDSRAAARRFYHVAAKNHLTVAHTSMFMVIICRCILQLVRKAATRANTRPARTSDSAFVSADILESFEENFVNQSDSGVQVAIPNAAGERQTAENEEEEGEEEEEEISLRDTELMGGLLDVVLIMWNVIDPALKKDGYEDIRGRLEQRFTVALPEYLRAFHEPDIVSTLILIAGFLPANAVPMLSRSMLSKLRGMTSQSTEDDYASMLRCMCHWGKADDVLQLISDWLESGLTLKSAEENISKRASTGRRSVMFREPCQPQPLLGLQYLLYMIRVDKCRDRVLATDSVKQILKQLQTVTKLVEKRFSGTDDMGEHVTDDVILQAFEMYLKLEVLLHDSADKTHNATVAYGHAMTWADAELLVLFRKNATKTRREGRKLLGANDATLLTDASNTMGQTTLGVTLGVTLSTTLLSETVTGKRTMGDSNMAAVNELASSLLESLLRITSEVMLIGVADQELAAHVADFAVQILKLENSARFLPLITTLMYQITQFTLHSTSPPGADGGTSPPGEGTSPSGAERARRDIVADMLRKLIEMLVTLVGSNREQAERVLPSVKPAVTEMLLAYYKHLSLNRTINQDIISTVTEATIADMKSTVKKDNFYESRSSVADLPPLTAFLLSVLLHRKQVASLYVSEMYRRVEGGTVDDVYGVAACLHILMPITADKKLTAEVKECVRAVHVLCENVELPADVPEEAPSRHVLQQNKTLLKDCMTKMGMVA